MREIRFEFSTAGQVRFGRGTVDLVPSEAALLGRKALVVTGRRTDRVQPLLAGLKGVTVHHTLFPVEGEPTTETVVQGLQEARGTGCDLVISFGGGSAIDAGKAIAALMTNEGDLFRYLEVVGEGQPLVRPSAPFIAIPTTAGPGTEVTRNAVLRSENHGFKVSLRSRHMLPRLAVVDPDLTRDLPPDLTAQTGMDALSQLIEPYVSCRANPLVDGFCIEGMQRVARSLVRAHEQGDDMEAREDMALASLLGGMALANAGLGAVHGFAAPIGGQFQAPHGAVCAALLAPAMEVNLKALKARHPEHRALQRFNRVAHLLTGGKAAMAEGGIVWVGELCRKLGIPPLKQFGIGLADVPGLCEKARKASSMKANPIPLEHEELEEILAQAIGV